MKQCFRELRTFNRVKDIYVGATRPLKVNVGTKMRRMFILRAICENTCKREKENEKAWAPQHVLCWVIIEWIQESLLFRNNLTWSLMHAFPPCALCFAFYNPNPTHHKTKASQKTTHICTTLSLSLSLSLSLFQLISNHQPFFLSLKVYQHVLLEKRLLN